MAANTDREILILYMSGTYGGGGAYIYKMINALLLKQQRVDLVSFHSKFNRITDSNLNHFFYEKTAHGHIKAILKLFSLFHSKKIRVCIAGDHISVKFAILFKTIFPSTPWIYVLQSSYTLKNSLARRIFRGRLLRFIDGVCGVSNSTLDSLRELNYKDPTAVVYTYHESSIIFTEKKRHGNVVLLPARMVEGKGHIDLIRASEGHDWEIWFAGEGVLRPMLEKLCKENGLNVKFSGWVDNINELYLRATIIALPSYNEGLPLGLLEAMSLGKPVVAYDIEAHRELIKNGVTGSLVETGDYKALGRSIQMLIEDISYADRIAKQAKIETGQRFSITRTGDALINFIDRITDEQ